MSNHPTPQELHDRAGEAAKETREAMIKLTTASVGVLAFISTRDISPPLDINDKFFLLASICFVVGSLGSAVWFGFADAQWAYWWAVLLDPEHPKHPTAMKSRDWWHTQKSRSEKAMLALFVVAAIFMGLFLISRVLKLGG
jgi:hypothetical protein